jgi:hypothetical protein
MDRQVAQRNLRVGLIFAGVAVAVFGLTFVLALLYIQ